MKEITPRSSDARRGFVVQAKSWDEIAQFYREGTGGHFVAMLPLVDALAGSSAARELWAFTSMHTLGVSDSVEHRIEDSTLYINYNPHDRTFEFHHHSFSGHDDRATCSEAEALQTLRNFLKYKFGVLLDGP